MRRKQRGPEVFRITGARQGLADDVRGRQRRYVISMLVRTASVLLTVLLWNVQRPLAVVTLVFGALLPYVAVVIANAGRENVPSLPRTYLATPPRPMLGPAWPEQDAPSEPRTVRHFGPDSGPDGPAGTRETPGAAPDGAGYPAPGPH